MIFQYTVHSNMKFLNLCLFQLLHLHKFCMVYCTKILVTHTYLLLTYLHLIPICCLLTYTIATIYVYFSYLLTNLHDYFCHLFA